MEENILTQHFAALLRGEVSKDREAVAAIKRATKKWLRDKRLWRAPPAYLGYQGNTWERSDALDELVHDAYIKCILERRATLEKRLQIGGNIDGWVIGKLHWHLADLHRAANPVGRRVYGNVKTASKSLVQKGVAVQNGAPPIRAKTAVVANERVQPVEREELKRLFAAELHDRSFVEMATKQSEAAEKQVESAIEKRFEGGLDGYYVGDLANTITSAAPKTTVSNESSLWSSEISGNFFDFFSDSRIDPQNLRYEKGKFDDLTTQLQKAATTQVKNVRIRKRVCRVIELLAAKVLAGEDIAKIKQTEIADELGVSTSTLSEDFGRIRNLVHRT